MRDKIHLGINIVLVVGLSWMGMIVHGPSYMTYIMGAGAIYFLVSSWLRSQGASQAMAAGLGCAWGWLAIIDGLMSQRWAGILIGLAVILVWVIPGFRGDLAGSEDQSSDSDAKAIAKDSSSAKAPSRAKGKRR